MRESPAITGEQRVWCDVAGCLTRDWVPVGQSAPGWEHRAMLDVCPTCRATFDGTGWKPPRCRLDPVRPPSASARWISRWGGWILGLLGALWALALAWVVWHES